MGNLLEWKKPRERQQSWNGKQVEEDSDDDSLFGEGIQPRWCCLAISDVLFSAAITTMMMMVVAAAWIVLNVLIVK